MEEKREIDRQGEILPIGVGDRETGQRPRVTRDQFEATFDHILKSECTGVACTNDLLRRHFEEMPMLWGNANAAELALLYRRPPAGLPPALTTGKLAEINQR